jgi:hypothetical protein
VDVQSSHEAKRKQWRRSYLKPVNATPRTIQR